MLLLLLQYKIIEPTEREYIPLHTNNNKIENQFAVLAACYIPQIISPQIDCNQSNFLYQYESLVERALPAPLGGVSETV